MRQPLSVETAPRRAASTPPSFWFYESGKSAEDVERDRKDNRGVFLNADFRQRLQIPKLDRNWLTGEDFRSVREALRSGEFAFRVNDLRALLAIRLRLLGHGAQHRLREIDLLHFDVDDLYAPGFRVLIEDALHARIQRVAVREQLVELDFAEDGAERGLSKLRCLIAVIDHLDHRPPRLDDAQKDDGVHLQRHVVARDDVLWRHFERFLAQ